MINDKPLFACFVDFQKAYDSVWRMGLYYKLLKNGVDVNIVRLVKNMYDKTSQTLKINGKVTAPFRTYKGVRQGCILSPRLFNMFINDLPEIFDQTCDPVKLGNIDLQCLNLTCQTKRCFQYDISIIFPAEDCFNEFIKQ